MTRTPPGHRLVQLTGVGTTVTGTVVALDTVVPPALDGSSATAAGLVVLVLTAAFAVLGVGVARRSLAAARGAGVIAVLLVPMAYVHVASAGPGPTPIPATAVGLAATVLFIALITIAQTLTAERNSARGGRYERPMQPPEGP
jgi:hypothetical protein